jgi:hypothetical protein
MELGLCDDGDEQQLKEGNLTNSVRISPVVA